MSHDCMENWVKFSSSQRQEQIDQWSPVHPSSSVHSFAYIVYLFVLDFFIWLVDCFIFSVTQFIFEVVKDRG